MPEAAIGGFLEKRKLKSDFTKNLIFCAIKSVLAESQKYQERISNSRIFEKVLFSKKIKASSYDIFLKETSILDIWLNSKSAPEFSLCKLGIYV